MLFYLILFCFVDPLNFTNHWWVISQLLSPPLLFSQGTSKRLGVAPAPGKGPRVPTTFSALPLRRITLSSWMVASAQHWLLLTRA